MRYDFLVDSYDSERIKVLSVWSEFLDEDLPRRPTQDDPRLAFMQRYAEDSAGRLERLRATNDDWWEALTTFFDVQRSRAWVMTRRHVKRVRRSAPPVCGSRAVSIVRRLHAGGPLRFHPD